ncbi:MAG TPA: HAMP domain-containing sensor histidine kinase, partial [Candidatus Saccharibacteria bacterium]|nr:HAMP domain-containing sensor histidine kinase [Candidatus Saccharibacteria bacterium]
VVLLGMVVSSFTGLFFNLVLPLFEEYRFVQLGPASAVFFVAMVGYAMVRHRLFDVRLAIVRSSAYFLVLLFLIGVYFVLAQLAANILGVSGSSTRQLAVNILLTLVIALIFQPVKRLFDKVTKRIFYRDSYDVDDFIAEFNQTLGSTIHLRTLLERVAKVLQDTFKAEFVFLSVTPKQGGRYINAGTKPGSRFSPKDAEYLEKFFEARWQGPLITSLTEEAELRRLLVSYHVEMVIPLWQNHKIMGYICFGDHRTSNYSQRDIRAIETIDDGLVIAIQNALSVQAVKDLNASLEQRIDAATRELRLSNAQLQRLDEAKDEFVSMASHQLRTPLTSVKGYISMLMEGDAGEVPPKQKQLLREAFMSSERMVRLIGDFLNVSRLQTGKFVIEKTPIDLSKIVATELDGLEPSAAAKGIKFVYRRPKKFPTLELDENKIRQVIMNFLDNAVFYSKEKAKVHVELTAKKKFIEFTVKDTGIGVPAEEQSRLFKKFFRASNARKQRPDGTGVGIFLAKKVVSDHKGEIIFESTEGKGSTFGFRLPID